MIICGFAGIGKSYYAHNFPNVMDLESTPFEKDWNRYIKCALYYHKQGYKVLLSYHKEVIELLSSYRTNEQNIITVVPSIGDKEYYRKLYEGRGNTEEFINIQMEHWDEWISSKGMVQGELRMILPYRTSLSECLENHMTCRFISTISELQNYKNKIFNLMNNYGNN